MVKTANHGKYLIEIGMENDLPLCVAIDSVPVLPMQISNTIKLQN